MYMCKLNIIGIYYRNNYTRTSVQQDDGRMFTCRMTFESGVDYMSDHTSCMASYDVYRECMCTQCVSWVSTTYEFVSLASIKNCMYMYTTMFCQV